jgi:hypothetical protein
VSMYFCFSSENVVLSKRRQYGHRWSANSTTVTRACSVPRASGAVLFEFMVRVLGVSRNACIAVLLSLLFICEHHKDIISQTAVAQGSHLYRGQGLVARDTVVSCMTA